MASHRFTQLWQQFLLVFGQTADGRQRIGGMVGAEDARLRRVEATDQTSISPGRPAARMARRICGGILQLCFRPDTVAYSLVLIGPNIVRSSGFSKDVCGWGVGV